LFFSSRRRHTRSKRDWSSAVCSSDLVATAGDLVQGKLGNVPVAVLRGLPISDDGSRAADLVRPAAEDLFRLGTNESIAQGRRERSEERRGGKEWRRGCSQ